jgi:hypothetical protein
MWANPGWLGRERDELLEHLLGLLRADAAVAGAALVGSLGAGTADEWSDIDLLIVMEDHEVARFADRSRKTPWSEAQVLVDGRHNSPAGATSAGAIHVRSGLPFRADLHVYPLSLARWPADSRVVYEARPVETSVMSFTDLNSSGPRQPVTANTPDEVRIAHLAMVPVVGKYIARRSAAASRMIQFLGGISDAGDDPSAQLRSLRAVTVRLSHPGGGCLADAVERYLDVVQSAMEAMERS